MRHTLVARYLGGLIADGALEDEFDDAVERWHKARSCSLPEWLGLTNEDYVRIVECPESLKDVITAIGGPS